MPNGTDHSRFIFLRMLMLMICCGCTLLCSDLCTLLQRSRKIREEIKQMIKQIEHRKRGKHKDHTEHRRVSRDTINSEEGAEPQHTD